MSSQIFGFPYMDMREVDINTVGIVGAGKMGTGIAQVFATNGFDVILLDAKKEILEFSVGKIKDRLDAQARKGRIEKEKVIEVINKIKTTLKYEDLKKADIIVEAVFEDLDLKKQVFSKLDKICPPETILASNTSSLMITDIAASTQRPDRVVGMHFFYPPFIMKLVEVVKGEETSDNTVSLIVNLSEQLGKIPVVVKDSPGLVSTRMGFAFLAECIRIVEQGLASVKDVDTIAKLGYGHPMGPFETVDMIGGIKILHDGLEYIYKETGDPRYAPPFLLKKLVKAGYFGNAPESKGGWYDYFKVKKDG